MSFTIFWWVIFLKGSLEDILENEKIKLDKVRRGWSFIENTSHRLFLDDEIFITSRLSQSSIIYSLTKC